MKAPLNAPMTATRQNARVPLPAPLRAAATAGLAALLSACLPAPVGPDLTTLTTIPAARWTPDDLRLRSQLPAGQVLPLAEALRRAPLGSLLVACEDAAAMWGPCRHLTRKISADQMAEEPGLFGSGAAQLPLDSLLRRDLVLVVDVGVRPTHLEAIRREINRLGAAPYLLNGQLDAFDCGTYQNALQRAAGLPDAVPLDPHWTAYLPSGVLSVPSNAFLFAGASDRLLARLAARSAAPTP
ncbi:hypothetical protein DEIGR_101801 [Deinococcus grandis]|uniref:Uncharacterized protein n=1 Tax=Deinococcus grandis TaxID=57498 RepID=A0A100HJ87_9DEIO|nr:hypothetical protein [Deinococcus grandis]BBN94729.1 hypothetical protein DEGR_14620 [Deinococcus grandis]GAQ21774.1 hypothetical protein DEIGR_101801 [Deinococcus grandis]